MKVSPRLRRGGTPDTTAVAHWTETAKHVPWDQRTMWVIGLDVNGQWWVPYDPEDQPKEWKPFNRWYPFHWLCYRLSKRRGTVVWVERGKAWL